MAGESGNQVQDFLFILKSRKWQILLPMLFVLSLGLTFAVVVPKKFEITTKVEIRETRVEEDIGQLRDPLASSTARELQNIEQHIRHQRRIRSIIEDNLEDWPEYVKLDRAEQVLFLRTIKNNLDVDVAAKRKEFGSTFVEVIYTDTGAERGKRFLEDLTERWIEEVVDRDRQTLNEELSVYTEQRAQAERNLRASELKYHDMARRMEIDPTRPLSDPEREGDPVFKALRETRAQLEELETQLFSKEALLEEYRAKLAVTPRETVEQQRREGTEMTEVVSDLRSQISEKKAQQDTMTPLNSRYKQLQREIDDLIAEIEEVESLAQDPVEFQVFTPNPVHTELQTKVDTLEAEVEAGQRERGFLEDLVREKQTAARKRSEEYRTLSELYGRLQRAINESNDKEDGFQAKRSALEVMERAWGEPYEIVEPAEHSPTANKPNPVLIVTVAAIVGLALGLFLAVASEFGKNSYRSVGEISRVMAVPVLGAVNAIVTRGERRRRHLRRAFVGLCSVVILFGIGWFAYMLHFDLESLPTEVQQVVADLKFMLY